MSARKIKRVKVPTVYQMEATECGAASLCMILKYFGKNISLEKVRIACGVSRDGSNALHLLRAAKSYGLVTKAYKKSYQALRREIPPMIIHWNFSHFVVYEGCNEKYIFINDPASGHKKVLHAEAEKSFTGIALGFKTGEDFEKLREQNGILRFIRSNIKNEHGSIIYMVLMGLCLIMPGLVIPVFSSIFIDEVLLQQHTELFSLILGGMLITVLFQCILSFSQQFFLSKLQNKMVLLSSWKFMDHILKLPVEFFNQRDASDISNRISNNEDISNFLSGELAVNVLHFITSSFYLTLMLIYNIKLTGIVFILMLVEFLFVKLVSPLVEEQNIMLQQETGKLTGSIVNGISSIDSLKAAGIENEYTSKVYAHQANCLEKEQETGVISRILNAGTGFSTKLMTILIMFIGGMDVINGNMTTGSLIAFNIIVAGFLAPVHELARFGTRIQGVKASINRVNDILNYEVDKQFLPSETNWDMTGAKLNGKVSIRNLRFGYNLLDKPLLEEISFEINPGKSIAIVGASGSGKSTVSKLIAGLFHPWSGEILFDGVNIEHIREEVLCSSVAMVSQELVFFPGTILENITLGDDTISDSQVINAAKDACIHDVITARREGYEHLLSEGGRNFSGGQLQRIEIARTLAKNPTVMILDEATSALDPLTELNIINNIKRRGCTLIIIAHRLSTIRNCDEIIVLDNGAIIQRGTHEDLKIVQGSYAELLRSN
ncbi:MAG: NHLP family bacteriocin export ABC transporter peptidase/permease/ATPase subunit [Mobilitalea sp.]